nr:ABC transporter permease [Phyllobacterium zundukense]
MAKISRPAVKNRSATHRVSQSAGHYSPAMALALLSPLLVLLLLGFILPIAYLVRLSLFSPHLDFSSYRRLFEEPLYFEVMLRTAKVALAVMTASLLLGYPIAYVMARTKGRLASAVTACVLIALWSPVLVRSYAFIVLLQRNGVINRLVKETGITETGFRLLHTEGAVMLAMTHVLMPFMILPIFAALRSIPLDYVQAARNLGAGPVTAFLRMTFPLSLPGVFAGCVMCFILALGFYVTPALIGGPGTLMAATLIGQQVTVLLDWPFAAALATILLLLTLVLVLVFRRAFATNRGFQGVN